MTVPRLPSEIVDYIIDMLVGDKASLLSCSTVSITWVNRCRHHLFAEIELRSPTHIRLWFRAGLGPSCHYVRSLCLTQDNFTWIGPETPEVIQNGLAAFQNVESLSLSSLNLTPFDEHSLIRFFGHFSERLTSLSVEGFTVDPDPLLFFICMFPKMDNLTLDYLRMGGDIKPFRRPTVTPRFRGKLSLLNIKSSGTALVASLSDLPMAFKDVCVENCRFEKPKPLKDLFSVCGEAMKKIKVCRIFFDDIFQKPLIDLSPCSGIEEIQLSLIQLRRPSHWIEPILRTVTSTRVRKITFDTDIPSTAAEIDSEINVGSWSRVDEILLKMADKVGGEKLELVFNALIPNNLGEFNSVDPGRFLEGCRAKAAVRFEPT